MSVKREKNKSYIASEIDPSPSIDGLGLLASVALMRSLANSIF